MIDRRYLGILIITTGVLLLIGIIYIIFIYKFTSPLPAEEVQNTVSEPPENKVLPPPEKATFTAEPAKNLSPEEVKQEDIKRMAASFAERFGSFSNQSNYSNIEDLEMFMTENMRSWAEQYIKEVTSKRDDASIYYGITTMAVSETAKTYDDDVGTAEILVRTKRREATGTTANASYFYQDILISFKKESGAWKVDSAYWQAKQQ